MSSPTRSDGMIRLEEGEVSKSKARESLASSRREAGAEGNTSPNREIAQTDPGQLCNHLERAQWCHMICSQTGL